MVIFGVKIKKLEEKVKFELILAYG